MPATHPIWALIRLTILMVTMTILLWINASNFDSTEIKSIVGVFMAAAAGEGVLARLTKREGSLRLQDGQVVDSVSYHRGLKDAGGD